jgi:hypothetical protein
MARLLASPQMSGGASLQDRDDLDHAQVIE